MPVRAAAAAFVLIIFALGIASALRRGKKSRSLTVLIAVLSLALVSVIIYLMLTAVSLYRLRPVPGSEAVPVIQTPEPTPEPPHPDVLGIRELKYDDMPLFTDMNQLSVYVLYNFLHENFSFQCLLDRSMVSDEGQGFFCLSAACENAMSYYLFSSYEIFDMYTEERGFDEGIWAKLGLEYTSPELDEEAMEAAKAFLASNPPPEGGFMDFESERAYCRLIHDFLADRLSYSPIGYDQALINGQDKYSARQEAYNALAGEDMTAVCAGYARGFALTAQYAGIDCAWVRGNEGPGGSHAWNVVYPCDGSEPVIVDVTWDDMYPAGSPPPEELYRFFYVPVPEDTSHYSDGEMLSFINYIHALAGDSRRLAH